VLKVEKIDPLTHALREKKGTNILLLILGLQKINAFITLLSLRDILDFCNVLVMNWYGLL
jgi:hypothetical protein